ncbi:hypothetical protein [Sphingosinicella sp. BN140058]|uniref:DUF3617 domain-containing protein n=1 Tax=Sphingosinicella sp. BN140058 TaxID=1892855 RepID=UPI001012901E|nr:hypothetical protein [Sphingosinicella sp. BN140058]QAY75611.1 hypothetical protein ETR14_03010 [Sphingosinicella sp. BN140058]
MRGLLLFAGALVVGAGYLGSTLHPGSPGNGPSGSAAAPPAASGGNSANGFPKAGQYDIVREGSQRSDKIDMWVDASNRQAFEELVARDDGDCRDKSVSIGGGSFSVRMTCDTPDGDIRNIPIERHGSYSENFIEIEAITRLWRTPIRETARYRLRKS